MHFGAVTCSDAVVHERLKAHDVIMESQFLLSTCTCKRPRTGFIILPLDSLWHPVDTDRQKAATADLPRGISCHCAAAASKRIAFVKMLGDTAPTT